MELAVILSLLVIIGNGYTIVSHWNDKNNVQDMADYIDANVPPNAIIESVEVELNALTSHHETHRADYIYV